MELKTVSPTVKTPAKNFTGDVYLSTFEVMRLRVPMRAGPDGFPRWWVELGESS